MKKLKNTEPKHVIINQINFSLSIFVSHLIIIIIFLANSSNDNPIEESPQSSQIDSNVAENGNDDSIEIDNNSESDSTTSQIDLHVAENGKIEASGTNNNSDTDSTISQIGSNVAENGSNESPEIENNSGTDSTISQIDLNSSGAKTGDNRIVTAQQNLTPNQMSKSCESCM